MYFSPVVLHIPDGFLSLTVALVCWLLTVVLVGLAISKTNRSLGDRQVPLMGVMAAFIFAAQMINFPVAGGTSGHLIGGALAAVLLGPWAAMIVMTAVIAVQALLLQDGGLVAMGANILNMGLLTVAISAGLYRVVARRSAQVRLLVCGAAAWLAVLAGALATSLELWLSSTVSLQVVVPAMLGLHAVIGVGEALITVAAVAFLLRTRPDLVTNGADGPAGLGWVAAGLALSALTLLLVPFASSDPDGLERVARDLGFLARGQPRFGPLIDYAFAGLADTPAASIGAGLVGALVVLAAILVVGRALRGR